MTVPQDIIRRIKSEFVAALLREGSLTPGQAKDHVELVELMVQEAIDLARQREDDIYTEGRGSNMLQLEGTDESIHAEYKRRRAEGVTDDDIRWWWNMSVFEQEMIAQEDKRIKTALFIYLRRQGLQPDKVVNEIVKRHAVFGEPDGRSGDDRPLPWELKHRIVSYIERHYRDPNSLVSLIANESSFNSLVRKEILAGNL
jgi:hypothetical protein